MTQRSYSAVSLLHFGCLAPQQGRFAPQIQPLASAECNMDYKRVVAILDGDKADEAERLRQQFPEYHFITHIKKDDIRDKPERPIQTAKEGIATIGGDLKPPFTEYANRLIEDVNNHFVRSETVDNGEVASA